MRDTSERFVNDFAEKRTVCENCHNVIEVGEAVVHDNVTDKEIHQGLCSPLTVDTERVTPCIMIF